MAHFNNTEYSLVLFGKFPSKKTQLNVSYTSVGVDENFQVAGGFIYYDKYSLVTGYGYVIKDKT